MACFNEVFASYSWSDTQYAAGISSIDLLKSLCLLLRRILSIRRCNKNTTINGFEIEISDESSNYAFYSIFVIVMNIKRMWAVDLNVIYLFIYDLRTGI